MAPNNRLEVSLNDLEEIVSRIFQNIKKAYNQDVVNLNRDYYYTISLEEKYPETVGDLPDVLMGQLYDDWEFLQRILSNSDEGSPLMLDHVAPLLRYIAYHFLPKDKEGE